MRTRLFLLLSLGVALGLALALTGCARAKITDQDAYTGGELPRPGRILVYDFAATPADLPAWSEELDAYQGAAASVNEKELAAGRKLGAELAADLVGKISKMGMTALRAEDAAPAELNDIAIVGYFSSIDPGSTLERVVVGFGEGASEVKTNVAAYHMTQNGMVKLGSGAVASGEGKGPGLVVPALVTIATANPIGLVVGGAVKAEGEISGRDTDKGAAERVAGAIAEQLEKRFKEQGWI